MKKTIKTNIKNIISGYGLFHYLYTIYSISVIKIKTLKSINYLRKKRLSVVEYKDLLKHAGLVGIRKNKFGICHIIGSGSSLNNSKKIIGKNDFVIGNNFAALCELDYDLYFVEFGGRQIHEISKSHIDIVKKKVLNKTSAVYFKNLWEDKNDVEYIAKNWANYVSYIKDYIVPCLSYERLEQVLRFSLNEKNKWLPQYTSTVITAVYVAYNLGYKHIVLHGVDFGGNYFYDADGFEGDSSLLPDKNKLDYNSSKSYRDSANKNNVYTHPTAKGSIGMKSILPILFKILEEKNVTLYSSTSCSKSSEYLPVWNDEMSMV